MANKDKVVVKSDGETIIKEKDFDDIVLLVRRKTKEDVIFIAGDPEIAAALLAEATAKLAEKVSQEINNLVYD